jgi:hypothetical protein
MKAARHGGLMVELAFAMAILTMAVLPLTHGFLQNQRLLRSYYNRAAAMQIIDGEMEALVAGEWKSCKPGRQDYAVLGESATNLPAGRFTLTLDGKKLRLEWSAERERSGGIVAREVILK